MAGEGTKDNNRKRKHGWNTHVKQKSVEGGLSGLFFTCDAHEKQALHEAYNIIDELLDGDEQKKKEEGEGEDPTVRPSSSSEGDDEEDVADTLKRKCDETRGARKQKVKRSHQRPTGVKNCLFVTVKDAEVVSLCDRFITLTQSSPRCRFLQRALPVEETAPVDVNNMQQIVAKLVERHLKPGEDGKLPTYALEFKTRNNDQIRRTAVLEMLNEAVGMFAPAAKVDLSDAEVTFFVQVVRKTIMAGTARRYFSRRKFSCRPKEEVKKSEE